ncbi:MAG: hypothetical protein FD167_1610, partial [bacterium]
EVSSVIVDRSSIESKPLDINQITKKS